MIEKDVEQLAQGLTDSESMDVLRALQPWQNEQYCRTDLGNAFLFADFFGDRARFMKKQNCWYVYDGRAWQMDENGLAARALIKALTVLLTHYCHEIPDTAMREMMMKQVERWHSRRGRQEILLDAQDIYPLSPEMMDANPMYLNCQNGTLDLETGMLHPHTASDLQSHICGADFIPGVRCERWEQFVLEVMRKSSGQMSLADEEEAKCKAAWIKRMLGYALTGDTSLECLFILYGATTRNGKSTMMETMLKLMGDYGMTIQPESLGLRARAGGSGPSEDIARLHGARFVCAPEPDKRLMLSASHIKTMTGNDTITARNLYQSSFQYKPQFKLFINTNHLPETGDDTMFESKRVNLVPFERHFEPYEQDRGLKRMLVRPICLTGILNWCLEGLHEMRADGFTLGDMPESARACLVGYQAENDTVGQFVKECLAPADGRNLRSSDVYRAYARWCGEMGLEKDNAVLFRKQLEKYYSLGKRRIDGGNPTNAVCDCEFAQAV